MSAPVHAITLEQVERRIIRTLEEGIRRLLAEPDFCPDTERLDRYARMPISADLLRDLQGRYNECFLSLEELEGRE